MCKKHDYGSEWKWKKNHINYWTLIVEREAIGWQWFDKIAQFVRTFTRSTSFFHHFKCPKRKQWLLDWHFEKVLSQSILWTKYCFESVASSIHVIKVHYMWWLNCTDTKHEQILFQFHNWLHFHEFFFFIVAHKQHYGTLYCHYHTKRIPSISLQYFNLDTVLCII